MIGFCGAHRSGKTTLAKFISSELDIPFIETSTFQVMQDYNINIVENMPLEDRVNAQEILLDHHVKTLREAKQYSVLDRTPIDMMAYLIGETNMHNVSNEKLLNRIANYKQKALRITHEFYDAVVHVSALTQVREEAGKPPVNLVYQAHIEMLTMGGCMMLDTGKTSLYRIRSSDLESRKRVCVEIIKSRNNKMVSDAQAAMVLH